MTARSIASRLASALTLSVALGLPAGARQTHIDIVTPAAPELAALGTHAIGVRTLTVSEPGRVDVLNTRAEGPIPRYTRALTLEVWYPAQLPRGNQTTKAATR